MQITIDVTWRKLEDSIDLLVSDPNRSKIQDFLLRKEGVLKATYGSTNNHQTWRGGWWDHTADGLSLAPALYSFLSQLRPLPFSVEDLALSYFGHDLEKPFAYDIVAGRRIRKDEFKEKSYTQAFREKLLADNGIAVTDLQINGMLYAEGELDDYTNQRRVMSELAGVTHMLDTASARVFHDYPKAENDEWPGAFRVNFQS